MKRTASEPVATSKVLQRKCACGQHTVAGSKCDECRRQRLNLQRRAANQTEPATIPPVVHEVRSIGWLLTKILGVALVGDDVVAPQIGEGTAPDRILSLTEPEMRHSHKSKSRRFDWFKALSATEPSSELLMDITDIPASGNEGAYLLLTTQRIEAHADVVVERAIGDGAFGSGKLRAACAT